MIPIALHLKNFLSYGNVVQTINFAPYHLICLSGKNGHGKSALLDALTWALWGQARKTLTSTKPDEGLLRLGQTAMMVMLDFQCGGQTFRVRREFTLSKNKTTTYVDFGLLDQNTEQIKPLTNKSIRATQEKINHVLGLDYDAFINSVFLRQGQANEFSKKLPKERKEILSRILGLEKFELMRKQALEKIRLLSTDKEYLRTLVEQVQLELTTQKFITAQLTHVITELEEYAVQETALKAELTIIMHKKKMVQEQQTQTQLMTLKAEHVAQQIQEKTTQVLRLSADFRETLNKWRQHKAFSYEQEKIATEKQCAQLQEQKETLLKTQEQLLILKNKQYERMQQLHEIYTHELYQKTTAYQAATHTLDQLHMQLQETIRQSSLVQMEYHELENRYALACQKDKQLEQQLVQLPAQEKLFERRKTFFHTFVARGNNLHAELKTITQKKKLMHETHNPSCPLCSQNLSEQHKKTLVTQFTHQEMLYNHQLQRLTGVIAELKKILHDQHLFIEQLKQQQHEYKVLQTTKINLEQKQKELNAKIKELSIQATTVELQIIQQEKLFIIQKQAYQQYETSFESIKETDQLYASITNERTLLETQLTSPVFDDKLYQALQQKLATLYKQVPENHAYDIVLQGKRKQETHDLITHIKILKKEYYTYHQHITLSENSTSTSLEQQEKAHQEKLAQLQQNQQTILLKKGGLEQTVQLLTQKEKEYTHLQQKIILTHESLEQYQAIAHALSKDGIQALLIENALPELEHEANMLLSRLTDNQAQLSIDSIRDLKNGGTKETLDIKISDTIGIRPYELFSGGEAFRIDFALRIALSKLVARRAGTALQTLIIDEGFGSQDEDGLMHIMDALYKIQEDFAKIIIVSHLPTLKDQFPVHFIINKGPQGSTVRISEQG
ncbi:MAG: SMC family ATPase [Candidatus Babeliaceae bacterium]